MGMVFEAVAITSEQATAMTTDQQLLDSLLFDDQGGEAVDSAGLDNASARDDAPSRIDLDKSWHGIHFLLTRSARDTSPPLGLAILGGRNVGEDNGYGPARVLDPPQVRIVADALTALDHDRLRRDYDPAAFVHADIYPSGIWREPDIISEYLIPNLQVLTTFYAQAGATGRAVLLALT
jgi:hypothetical protein